MLEEQAYQMQINKLVYDLEQIMASINEIRRELIKLSLAAPCA